MSSLADVNPDSDDTVASRIDDIIDYGRLTERYGLDVFGVGEHHTAMPCRRPRWYSPRLRSHEAEKEQSGTQQEVWLRRSRSHPAAEYLSLRKQSSSGTV